MSRIDTIFKDGHKAIIPFIVAGDPSIEITEATILSLDKAGADIIEIGVNSAHFMPSGPPSFMYLF